MGIGLSAWLFRLWLVLYYRPTCAVPASDCYTVAGDAWYHHSQANLIADGHWFKNGIEYRATGALVESAGDPPLYPLFLAASSSLGLDSVTWHRGVSTLAGGALVVLIGLFARRLASDLFGSAVGDKAGVVAALLAAVHPLLWINDIMLLSEGLYQPLIVAVGWAGYVWSREPTRRRIVLLGVAIACAAMTRAEAISLFGLLLLPLLAWGNPLGRADRVRQAGLGIGVGVIVLAPWPIYNNLRFEEPVTLTSATGQVLLAGSCDPAWEGDSMGFWAVCGALPEVVAEIERELPGSTRPFNDPDRILYDESVMNNVLTGIAFDYINDNRNRYPKVVLARMGRTLELFRVQHSLRLNYGIEGRWRVPSTAGLALYYLLLPPSVFALWVLRSQGVRLTVPLSLWAMVLFASATTFGLTRYRAPVDVMMVLLTGITASWLWGRYEDRRRETVLVRSMTDDS